MLPHLLLLLLVTNLLPPPLQLLLPLLPVGSPLILQSDNILSALAGALIGLSLLQQLRRKVGWDGEPLLGLLTEVQGNAELGCIEATILVNISQFPVGVIMELHELN